MCAGTLLKAAACIKLAGGGREQVPHCGHLVADGDGRAHDPAAARRLDRGACHVSTITL